MDGYLTAAVVRRGALSAPVRRAVGQGERALKVCEAVTERVISDDPDVRRVQ